jgi:hypothetical protein
VALEKFQSRLQAADQKWDSLRRIPYSTPGRWVQTLDLSQLTFANQIQALQIDTALTKLFPLLPSLARLSMNPTFTLSRRVFASLTDRECASNLCALEGINYVPSRTFLLDSDPLVKLLRACPALEEIDVLGPGSEPADSDFDSQIPDMPPLESFVPLELPKLHTLTLLSMHTSPLLLALLLSPLPSLRKVTFTPYDDIPYPNGLVTRFISVHGDKLRSLLLFTPKIWPTRLHPSPDTLLETCPILRHLSLEIPLPKLKIPATHPLQILSIPRPNDDFWREFEKILPRLPRFCMIRIRDVRWLRKGMNSRAQVAGVQGEMREWRKRLSRRGIRLVDADWNENNE